MLPHQWGSKDTNGNISKRTRMTQIKQILSAMWQLCNYVFVPRWGNHPRVMELRRENSIIRKKRL